MLLKVGIVLFCIGMGIFALNPISHLVAMQLAELELVDNFNWLPREAWFTLIGLPFAILGVIFWLIAFVKSI